MNTRGTITQTSPLLVQLDTSQTQAPATRLASYTPVVGHRVLVQVLGRSLIVLGQEV